MKQQASAPGLTSLIIDDRNLRHPSYVIQRTSSQATG